MKTDFKVYKRKIHVWVKHVKPTPDGHVWNYAWSTNAYKTCRDAVAAAKLERPQWDFVASFAKP
jgi:hypothetical protein